MQINLVKRAQDICQTTIRSGYRWFNTSSGRKILPFTGRGIYTGLRIRDLSFLFGAPLILGDTHQIGNALKCFITHTRKGFVPLRLVLNKSAVDIKTLKGIFTIPQKTKKRIKMPDIISRHFDRPADANALFLNAIVSYIIVTEDKDLALQLTPKFKQLLSSLLKLDSDKDLLIEHRFITRWQDLLLRKDCPLFTNLCLFRALKKLIILFSFTQNISQKEKIMKLTNSIRLRINAHFWDPDQGFFKFSDQHPEFSTESNLLAIMWKLADTRQANLIISNINNLELDSPVPCRNGYPEVPLLAATSYRQLSLTPKRHQKNPVSYSWLGLLYAMANSCIGNQILAEKVLDTHARIIIKNKTPRETIKNDNFLKKNLNSSIDALLSNSGSMRTASLFIIASNYITMCKSRKGAASQPDFLDIYL